jgi:hypothetical protein
MPETVDFRKRTLVHDYFDRSIQTPLSRPRSEQDRVETIFMRNLLCSVARYEESKECSDKHLPIKAKVMRKLFFAPPPFLLCSEDIEIHISGSPRAFPTFGLREVAKLLMKVACSRWQGSTLADA